MFAAKKSVCCVGFDGLLANAGKRGLAALVESRSTGLGFTLQARGLAHEDLPLLRPVPDGPNVHWSISSSTGLRFCPFCGESLTQLLKWDRKRYEQLAQLHAKYVDA